MHTVFYNQKPILRTLVSLRIATIMVAQGKWLCLRVCRILLRRRILLTLYPNRCHKKSLLLPPRCPCSLCRRKYAQRTYGCISLAPYAASSLVLLGHVPRPL